VFARSPALVVAAVDVQDPGNLGTIIRSAAALGATGVVATAGGADPAGWKALRGAMGGTFHVPVARATLADAVAAARRHGARLVAAVATGGPPAARVDLTAATCLLVGNEGAGLPPGAMAATDVRVTIPMQGVADSLNVAAATAILLYEAGRQRDEGRVRP